MTNWALWDWPFFEAKHHKIAERVSAWNASSAINKHSNNLSDQARAIVRDLASSGLLEIVVPKSSGGQVRFDARALCVAREGLAYEHVLADAMFTMQGLGTAVLSLYGTEDQKDKYLPSAREGGKIAGFALSEPEAGSDVAAVSTVAEDRGDHFVLNGTKTWISNAGLADHYIVIARTGEAPGARGLSAFIIDSDTPGLRAEPFELIMPHPIGKLTFDQCQIAPSALIGGRGQGFKLAMSTFDFFRPSVGAAAVGIARRALDESLTRVSERKMFGRTMGDIETVQMKLADMTVDTETAALTVYRAAWHKDVKGGRGTREASIAKLVATEAAQRVVDSAVQLFGGQGLVEGGIIGKLYREVRPMRIYEGASEVQKLVIARSVLSEKLASLSKEVQSRSRI